MVKDFIVMIQEEFTLQHVNFLTSENSVEFLGRTIKNTPEWQHHYGVLSEVHLRIAQNL